MKIETRFMYGSRMWLIWWSRAGIPINRNANSEGPAKAKLVGGFVPHVGTSNVGVDIRL